MFFLNVFIIHFSGYGCGGANSRQKRRASDAESGEKLSLFGFHLTKMPSQNDILHVTPSEKWLNVNDNTVSEYV